MNVGEVLHRFDRYQVKRAWLAVPVAVIKKFTDDNASKLAALVSYYAFVSLFPLLLVFTTILGFVLSGNPGALDSARESVLGRIPVIGDAISTSGLEGSTIALIVGVAVSLYAGLGITNAATYAMDRVWDVPRAERHGFFHSRLRGLVLLFLIGGTFIVASAAIGLLSAGLGGLTLALTGILASTLLNFALFLVSFRVLCSAQLEFRWLVPGAAVSALVWTVLQAIGGQYIDHIAKSHSAYGAFALVLGVIAWLHLGAQATVLAAELNVVLARRLWPRLLFTGGDLPPDVV